MGLLERIYKWMFRSLANQLLFTYLVIIVISLLAVSLWALFAIKSESVTDLRNSLEVEAVHLALEIDNDLGMDSEKSRQRIQSAVDRHATKLGVAITVVDRDGRVLADSQMSSQGPDGQNISNNAEINDALAGIVAIYTRNERTTNSNWLYVACPVRAGGQTTGVIRVGVQLTEIEQRLHRDLIIFLEIIFATGVMTVLISLWLARRVNRPLQEMSMTARKIAASGDMSETVPVKRPDEVGELARSFNQMIRRLREQERLRQEFIANASHELKTPTMAIGSVVEALQAGAAEDPKLRVQFLESLERLVDRQANLLQDLLDISRLDSGLDMSKKSEINVQQLITDAVEQVRPNAEKKQVELGVESQVDGAIVNGNSIHLQRALVNILANAINYTSKDGNVSVKAIIDGDDEVEIKISDTGIGIDAGDLPHIFERFYRADKARSRQSGGSGLGLAITQEIIARHQGSVNVESEVGVGSTFIVRLPVKLMPQTAKIEVALDDESASVGHANTVLGSHE
ncbi:MAG: HAMP domain-containing protein [Candidatus Melainabacteria bacterium]|jgi:signal transduction histidine kinase|nr:HAMP domain-containing protein [Candidatus Melainabacteria bacterium]